MAGGSQLRDRRSHSLGSEFKRECTQGIVRKRYPANADDDDGGQCHAADDIYEIDFVIVDNDGDIVDGGVNSAITVEVGTPRTSRWAGARTCCTKLDVSE